MKILYSSHGGIVSPFNLFFVDDITHSVTKKSQKSRDDAEKSSRLESKSDSTSADSSVVCTCKCHETQAPSSHTTEIPSGEKKDKLEVKEKTAEEEAHDLMVKG